MYVGHFSSHRFGRFWHHLRDWDSSVLVETFTKCMKDSMKLACRLQDFTFRNFCGDACHGNTHESCITTLKVTKTSTNGRPVYPINNHIRVPAKDDDVWPNNAALYPAENLETLTWLAKLYSYHRYQNRCPWIAPGAPAFLPSFSPSQLPWILNSPKPPAEGVEPNPTKPTKPNQQTRCQTNQQPTANSRPSGSERAAVSTRSPQAAAELAASSTSLEHRWWRQRWLHQWLTMLDKNGQ